MAFILGFGLLCAELLVYANLSARLGFRAVLAATIVTSAIGWLVLRLQGRMAQAQMRGMAERGGAPAGLVESLIARLVGGFLLLLPGFLTDLLGLTVLFPVTRPLWRRLLHKGLARGGGGTGSFSVFFGPGARGGPAPRARTDAPAGQKILDADFEVID